MLLFAICDISHLGKNIRNALYNRKVLWISEKYVKENNLVSSEVRWEHIVKLVEFEKKMRLKNASHLSKKDIELTNFSKMKVSLALHVLSKKTGSVIRWYVDNYPKEFPKTYLTTAYFCDQVGEFIDITANYSKSMEIIIYV